MDENIERTYETIREKIQIWHDYVIFTDLWWFGVALTIVPWVIWYWTRPKQSTCRLLFVSLYVSTLSIVLDVIGDQLGLWHYRFHVIPLLPTYVPWDLTLMPVTILFLLQIKPHWNPFVKALIFGLGSAYIGEPFFHWLRIYEIPVPGQNDTEFSAEEAAEVFEQQQSANRSSNQQQ